LPIRAATIADIPAMMVLAREASSAAHWSQRQYEIAVSSPDRIASVLEEDSALAAFLVARVLDREWEIENVVVASHRRRRGLAASLLAEIINLARLRKADAIFLEVRESNRDARYLYEKNGFLQTGRRPRYYREPEEDALLYRFAIP
jgi:[ribosomal protein S18]-alanine N-acetyltransferase